MALSLGPTIDPDTSMLGTPDVRRPKGPIWIEPPRSGATAGRSGIGADPSLVGARRRSAIHPTWPFACALVKVGFGSNSRPQGAPRNDRVPIGSKSTLIRLILEPRAEQREKRKPPARAFRTSIRPARRVFRL